MTGSCSDLVNLILMGLISSIRNAQLAWVLYTYTTLQHWGLSEQTVASK